MVAFNDEAGAAMGAFIVGLYSLFAVSTFHPPGHPSVANTSWCVHAAWQKNPFHWDFDSAGRYKDSDGPTGSWTQDDTSLTLNADAGFTFRAALDGNSGTGTAYQRDSGTFGGSFRMERMKPDAKTNCHATATP